MGKASQSKKVARAARAAGPVKASRRRWLWPAAIVAILVLGGVVIVESRLQSHPAPAQQITNEDTTTTAVVPVPSSDATGSATTLNPATATTAAGASSSSAAPSTTAATSSTTAKP